MCPKNSKDWGFFRFPILMITMILAMIQFTYVVRTPIDRGLSGAHQRHRNASNSEDSYDMELGSSVTEWDA